MNSITMNEIARLCGVSRATVSAIVNGKSSVSEKTRQRVLETMRQHQVHHRLLAPSLHTHFSQMFAMVVSYVYNAFYSEIRVGYQDVMQDLHKHMMIHLTDGTLEDEIRTVDSLLDYNFAGFVVVAAQSQSSQEHLQRIMDRGFPLVLVGRAGNIETHRLELENRPGGRIGADYLITKGHRKIICLAGMSTTISSRERALGFVESLIEHKLPFDDSMIVWTESTSNSGYVKALEILRDRETRPTALLCFNDVVALGVYRAAYELGLRIPDDISIIGFDNIEIGQLLGPPLTTVAVPQRLIGQAVAEIMLAILKGETKNGYIHRVMPASLLERGSVKDLTLGTP